MRTQYKLIFVFVLVALSAIVAPMATGYDEFAVYDKAAKTYTISNIFTGKMAEIELIYNDYSCLVECKTIIDVTPYKNLPITTDNSGIAFKDWLGKSAEVEYDLYIEYNKTVLVDEYTTNCKESTYRDLEGKEQSYFSCPRVATGKKVEEVHLVREPYDFSARSEPFRLVMSGKKPRGADVDWVPTILNHELSSWVWWNSSLSYYVNLSVGPSSVGRTNTPIEIGINFSHESLTEPYNDTLYLVDESDHVVEMTWYNETQDGGTLNFVTLIFLANMTAGEIENFSLYYDKTSQNDNEKRLFTTGLSSNATAITVGDWYTRIRTGTVDYIETDDGPVDINTWYWTDGGNVFGTGGGEGSCSVDTTGAPLKSSYLCTNSARTLNFTVYARNEYLDYQTGGWGTRTWSHAHVLVPTSVGWSDPKHSFIYNESAGAWYDKHNTKWTGEKYGGAQCWSGGGATQALCEMIDPAIIANGLFWGPLFDSGWSVYMGVNSGFSGYSYSPQHFNGTGGPDDVWYQRLQVLDNDTTEILAAYNEFKEPVYLTAFSSQQEIPVNRPDVIINSPSSDTYINSTLFSSFTVLDNASATLTCYRNLNGVETSLGAIANGSTYTESMPYGERVHTLNYSCVNGEGILGNESVTPTIVYWNLSNSTYFTTGWELYGDNFSANFRTASNVSNIDAYLVHGSNKSYDLKGNSDNWFNISKVNRPDLISTNNSATQFYWNFSVSYANGTNYDNQTGNISQSIYWSFHILDSGADVNKVVEGENYDVESLVWEKSGVTQPTTKNVTLWYEGNLSQGTKINSTGWRGTATALGIDDNNVTQHFKGIYNLSYGGVSTLRNTSNVSMDVYKLNLDNCSDYSTLVMRVWFKNESNKAAISQTAEMNFIIWNNSDYLTNESFKNTNETIPVCIYPSWASIRTNATIEYYSAEFPHRNYYLVESVLDNVTDQLYLYNIHDGLDTLVTVNVIDRDGFPEYDVLVNFQKFFIEDNQYVSVAHAKTDYDGKGVTYLNLYDTFYKIILTRGGEVLRTFSAMKLTSNELVLPLTERIVEKVKYTGSVATSCTLSNSTGIGYLTCSFTDTSNTARKVCLRVDELGTTANNTVYNSCSDYSSAVTHVATLGDPTDRMYSYVMYAEFEESKDVFESGLIDFKDTSTQYGLIGLFAAMILITVLVGIGLQNFQASLILSFIGLVGSWQLGILPLATETVLAIGLAVGILVYLVRRTT